MAETTQQPQVRDERVPALAMLLSPEARGLLDAVLAPAGGSTQSVRVAQVRYQPGSSVTVQYRASVRWADGSSSNEILIAASGLKVPDGVATLSDGDVSIAMWRFPDDPFLPGLAAATDPRRVQALLDKLGASPGTVRLRTRAYRPGRRAVIEVSSAASRIFVKVLRPSRVEALQRKHVAMAAHVPVPHSLGWADELGIVALQAMPGKTMRKALESGTRRLPTGAEIVSLLDSFPEAGDVFTHRDRPADRTPTHAGLLSAVLPGLAERLGEIVRRTRAAPADEPSVPVHGDFHSSQILVRNGAVVGLIDVDTAGTGGRTDDLAGLLGHLASLSLTSPARRNIDRYGASLIAEFDRLVDPRGLRTAVAAVVLGLATGPFRVQLSRWVTETERRVALAERWLETADAL